MFNRLTDSLKNLGATVASSLVGSLALVGSAFAEVPADVTTAITSMKTDALVVAGAVLVAIIAVAAVKFIRKGL